MKISDVKLILEQLNVRPSKKKGQNFLINNSVLRKIIQKSKITSEDIILEIGPGLGVLTEELVKNAKKVILIEIETKFCSYLSEKFSNMKNIEIINDDILNIDIPFHTKLVSNIPYTMTGPILEKIFFKENPPTGIIIIEKTLAERIYNIHEYKKISRIGIGVKSFMKPVELVDISRYCFYPVPNIDLALIKLDPKPDLDSFLTKENTINFYLKFIAGVLPYKNKDIVNAINSFFSNHKKINLSKRDIIEILQENKIENKKTFSFKIDEFINLSKIIYYFLRENTKGK